MLSTIKLSVRQIEEALSKENAYFYFVNHGKPHNDPMDLIRHYVANARPYTVRFYHVDETCAEEGAALPM